MNFLHRTWAEIDISALVHNFKLIKEMCGDAKIMAVVKANAYGHSAADIAPVLQKNGADGFAVSNIDEALQLRECGITGQVLILGYTPVECVNELCKNDISQCVYSKEYALSLSEAAVKNGVEPKIHIKIDTGMSRLGFDCRNGQLNGIADAIYSAGLEKLAFEGVFTHFASADRSASTEDGFTDRQYRLFSEALKRFSEAGLYPEICHCCNSAALIADCDKHLDMCRPGIILYGLAPSDAPELKRDFIPVMTLKSVISMVKSIAAGDTVSYGRVFKAERDMKIATVAAGYADGYPRALSDKAEVSVNGVRARVLGRICMDQLLIDVSHIESIKMGDEVILFGKELSVDELASLCKTVNYEIVCGISPRVPRIIKNA